MNVQKIVWEAERQKLIVPAYNVPFLPMVEPVIQAAKDEDVFAMVQVARADWEKFQAESLEKAAREYLAFADGVHTSLHLDHVPVIDEDGKLVDYEPIIRRAVQCGYQSVMLDASRLPLEENIRVTVQIADYVHQNQIPLESELGMVMGHESGPTPPYEEIFRTRRGFTRVEDAVRYVREAGCDWLSVAIGNIHGALSDQLAGQPKPAARLDIDHLRAIHEAEKLPIVLHGGSGIPAEYIRAGMRDGIAKINIGTELRVAYVRTLEQTKSVAKAQDAVYDVVRRTMSQLLQITGSARLLHNDLPAVWQAERGADA